MTQEQYEQYKQRLKEQLQTGIRLLESAHQAQVRALDLVWMLQAEGTAAVPAIERAALFSSVQASSPSPAPSAPRRPGIANVESDLLAALPRLPGQFTRGDVCEALGYEPDRGSLYRLLQELTRNGTLRVESLGSGRKATIYCRRDV